MTPQEWSHGPETVVLVTSEGSEELRGRRHVRDMLRWGILVGTESVVDGGERIPISQWSGGQLLSTRRHAWQVLLLTSAFSLPPAAMGLMSVGSAFKGVALHFSPVGGALLLFAASILIVGVIAFHRLSVQAGIRLSSPLYRHDGPGVGSESTTPVVRALSLRLESVERLLKQTEKLEASKSRGLSARLSDCRERLTEYRALLKTAIGELQVAELGEEIGQVTAKADALLADAKCELLMKESVAEIEIASSVFRPEQL